MRGLAFGRGRWHDGVLYARLRDDPNDRWQIRAFGADHDVAEALHGDHAAHRAPPAVAAAGGWHRVRRQRVGGGPDRGRRGMIVG
jgi:hypothetical protein